MTVVKLAEHECGSPCNAHRCNGFVSDVSALPAEDVYEGISSPHCISFTSNGLLKPQKLSTVAATITGKLADVSSDLHATMSFPFSDLTGVSQKQQEGQR